MSSHTNFNNISLGIRSKWIGRRVVFNDQVEVIQIIDTPLGVKQGVRSVWCGKRVLIEDDVVDCYNSDDDYNYFCMDCNMGLVEDDIFRNDGRCEDCSNEVVEDVETNITSAEFTNNKRSKLERIWDNNLPVMNIIMDTPSTADAQNNDQTTTSCISISKHNNYGSINIVNIGDKLVCEFKDEKKLVVAWGGRISGKNNKKMVDDLRKKNNILYCFKKLVGGNPGLPTRLAKNTDIIPYI